MDSVDNNAILLALMGLVFKNSPISIVGRKTLAPISESMSRILIDQRFVSTDCRDQMSALQNCSLLHAAGG